MELHVYCYMLQQDKEKLNILAVKAIMELIILNMLQWNVTIDGIGENISWSAGGGFFPPTEKQVHLQWTRNNSLWLPNWIIIRISLIFFGKSYSVVLGKYGEIDFSV